MSQESLLVIEDSRSDFLLLQDAMASQRHAYDLVQAGTLAEGIKQLSEREFWAVLLDLRLPDASGIDCVRTVAKNCRDCPIIVLTGETQEEIAVQALSEGAQDYIVKDDIDGRRIHLSIAYARERFRLLTEREALEKRLLQLQRLDAITALAGGVVHDMRNLLTPVIGGLDLLAGVVDDDAKELVRTLQSSATQAHELLDRLRQASRMPGGQSQQLGDANDLVQTALDQVLKLMPRSVTLTVSNSAEPLPVRLDPIELHQVLLNLTLNSVHAFGGAPGAITISLSLLPAGGAVSVTRNSACIDVKDNGPGIPHAIAGQIFDPFFTTKGEQGTGLGLAICKEIVERYGGQFMLCPSKTGAHFRILLPLQVAEEDDVEFTDLRPMADAGGYVLLVDDDPRIVKISSQMLASTGLEVRVFQHAEDALECFKTDPDGCRAVVTDQSMPGMKGSDLAEAVKKIRPNVFVLLVTGIAKHLQRDWLRTVSVDAAVGKPFTRDALVGALLSSPSLQRIH